MLTTLTVFTLVVVLLSFSGPRAIRAQGGRSVIITPENAHQVIQLRELELEMVENFAWSPDSRTLAVASSEGVWFYNRETMQLELLDVDFPVLSLAYSSDGTILATGGRDGSVNCGMSWRAQRSQPCLSMTVP